VTEAPTYDTFTAEEILIMLEDLGYWARTHENDDRSLVVRSRCDGIAWQADLVGWAPFHLGLRLKVPLLVKSDPFRWANDWNSTRYSQAYTLTDPESGDPVLDVDGHSWVNVESLVLFESGVTAAHVSACLQRWVDEVIHVHSIPEVTYFEELPL